MQFARGNNLSRVKVSNKYSILQIIYYCGPIKRAEVAKLLGLTLPTITTNINDMIAAGIVCETDDQGEPPGNLGRKARLVDIVPESRYFIGLEMQGSRRAVCVLDFRGRTLYSRQEEGPCADYERNMARSCAMINEAVEATGLPLEQVHGIGFCLPGLVNSGSGVLDTMPSYGWLNKDIRSDARRLTGYTGPIYVENNACARAYGAQLFRWDRLSHAQTFAYLFVSRGIACPLLLNTDESFGSLVGAGEVGHMIMEPNGLPCSCGNRGCLEAYSSEKAILARCAEAVERGEAPVLSGLCPGGQGLSMAQVLRAQEQGDEAVCRIIENALDYLGVAVANINNFACPRVMVIDGLLFTREENRKYLLDVNYRNLCNVVQTDTQFIFAEPDDFGGARGAAARAIFKNLEPQAE